MKISYEEPKDLRIDAKRPIWREFFMVFVVQTVCVFAGSIRTMPFPRWGIGGFMWH